MKARRPHAVTTGVVVCSLRPTDRIDVQDLHERMDQHDAYLRFFGARPKHLEDLAESLCRQDPGRCAVGAFIGGILVGVANYVSPPTSRTTTLRWSNSRWWSITSTNRTESERCC
jgi:hypothetical protein